jgi:hypothetical protein
METMMTEFDPLKAQRELVAGLRDMYNLIRARSLDAQRKLAEIEADANALMKMERFAAECLEEQTRKLRRLNDG